MIATGQTLALKDGRRLGWAEYGDPGGTPMFFFHGFPGSRLEAGMGDEAARRAGVRTIAVDRPGSGLSDYKAGRRIIDWPDDVAQLADHLGLEKFGVTGVSGGGPYAAVCAYGMPERVSACGLISSVGEITGHASTRGMSTMNRVIFGIGRWAPFLGYPAFVMMRRMASGDSDALTRQMMRSMPEPDRVILERPEIAEVFKEDLAEAMRQGVKGAVQDNALYSRPWGFPLGEIKAPVHIWQGELDRNVPVEHARRLAAAIPGSTLHLLPGEGHLLVIDRIEEILRTLVGEQATVGSKV